MPNSRPKKSLGQNFLTDRQIPLKMISAARLGPAHGVVEIGPGRGALTFPLCSAAGRVVALELDRELAAALPKRDNLTVIEGDVLLLPLREIIERELGGLTPVVFGNLPYYITTPIIMRLLEERLPVESIVVMVQKEAAERLAAPEGSREAGAVTMAVRYYSEPRILFDVPPESFYPRPSVTSSVLLLQPRPHPLAAPRDEAAMFRLVRAAFAQRRKRAVNSIAAALPADKALVERCFAELGLDRDIRAERLLLADFAALSDRLGEG